jgi:hypothetical protein
VGSIVVFPVIETVPVEFPIAVLLDPVVLIFPAVSNPETVAVAEDINPVTVADARVDAPALKAPATVAVAEDINPVTDADEADKAFVIDIKDAVIAVPTKLIVVDVPPIVIVLLVVPPPSVISPLLVASSYKEAFVSTVVPFCISTLKVFVVEMLPEL